MGITDPCKQLYARSTDAHETRLKRFSSVLPASPSLPIYKVMRHHPDACKHLIEMLLGIKIERMEMHNEEVIDIDHDSKGIRLDVFVKDVNKMYNVEMQVANTHELPERSRYYSAIMALQALFYCTDLC